MTTLEQQIIAALKAALPAAQGAELTPESLFEAVPGFDSMSAVSFQIELAGAIGAKANAVEPLPFMSVAEFANCLSEA